MSIPALLLASLTLLPAAAQTDEAYEEYVRTHAGKYQAYLDEDDRRFEAYVREIERRWGRFVPSTRPLWSSYSPELDTHGEVDFERGQVVVELLTDDEQIPEPDEIAERLIDQAQALMSDDNPTGRNVIEDQIDRGDGRPATAAEVDGLIERNAAEGRLEKRRVVTPEGRAQTVFSLTLPMVPDHLARASKPYLELVAHQAQRFGLPNDLVLAVIHTESWFNPFARSPAPAFGLMQLVPRAGALDAYRFLYGESRVVDADYLFEPQNNVELGCAYLHLLMNRYFAAIESLESRTLAAIAGYNCGPGNTRKALRTLDPDRRVPAGVSPDRAFAALTSRTPTETRNYLRLVLERRRMWAEPSG